MLRSLQLVLECHWEEIDLPIYLHKVISFNFMNLRFCLKPLGTASLWTLLRHLYIIAVLDLDTCWPLASRTTHTFIVSINSACLSLTALLWCPICLRLCSTSLMVWTALTAVTAVNKNYTSQSLLRGKKSSLQEAPMLPTAFMSIIKWTALNCFVEALLGNLYPKLFCFDSKLIFLFGGHDMIPKERPIDPEPGDGSFLKISSLVYQFA